MIDKTAFSPRSRRALRVRRRLLKRTTLPRLVIKRSLNHLYAQIIGPKGKVLATANSLALKEDKLNKTQAAKAVGVKLATSAQKNKITRLVLDRGRYRYHGRVKALAESLKENGIKL